MPDLLVTISTSCNAQKKGVVTYSNLSDPGSQGGDTYSWYVLLAGNPVTSGPLERGQVLNYTLPQDGEYAFRVGNDLTGDYSEYVYATIACAGTGGGTLPSFWLDSLTSTNETALGAEDGTATIQASGGTAPLTAEVPDVNLTQAATSGQPVTFPGLPVGDHRVQVRDADGRIVGGTVTIKAYAEPVDGCQDEYASNYDPLATSGGSTSCTYAVRWRSAWGPTGMAVRVPAVLGQKESFIEASLLVGFRPGHPLASDRPLGAPIKLRATVAPNGYATFYLGPFLRPLLGADDGAGGYRLDLNSLSAFTADLYVGYELRRADDDNTLLEHGYALNSAVPDEQLVDGLRLSPFLPLPLWPGFDDYRVPFFASFNIGKYGELLDEQAMYLNPTLRLPCPPNPLEVAWLAPIGGYGYWVFQGKTQLGDTVGEGQQFQEAVTGEQGYSERGAARRTYEARSGIYKGTNLAEGLATLWRSPQVWLRPTPASDWVPVTISSGDFPVRRLGVLKNEVTVTFTEAAAQYAQGQ